MVTGGQVINMGQDRSEQRGLLLGFLLKDDTKPGRWLELSPPPDTYSLDLVCSLSGFMGHECLVWSLTPDTSGS